MTDADLVRGGGLRPDELWWRRLAEAPAIGGRIGARPGEPHVHVRRADSGRLNRPAGLGWLAVGDAAAATDPLAAAGVCMAQTATSTRTHTAT